MEEIWKEICGYENKYWISNLGNVKNCFKVLKPQLKKNGYCTVGLFLKSKPTYRMIHRLVAQAFIPNPLDLPEVNHKDGVKTNCAVYNLEWNTSSENSQHAVDTGLSKIIGENNNQSKLSNDDVKKIKELKGVYSQRTLAKMFNVSKGAIHFIHHNINWKQHESNKT